MLSRTSNFTDHHAPVVDIDVQAGKETHCSRRYTRSRCPHWAISKTGGKRYI